MWLADALEGSRGNRYLRGCRLRKLLRMYRVSDGEICPCLCYTWPMARLMLNQVPFCEGEVRCWPVKCRPHTPNNPFWALHSITLWYIYLGILDHLSSHVVGKELARGNTWCYGLICVMVGSSWWFHLCRLYHNKRWSYLQVTNGLKCIMWHASPYWG